MSGLPSLALIGWFANYAESLTCSVQTVGSSARSQLARVARRRDRRSSLQRVRWRRKPAPECCPSTPEKQSISGCFPPCNIQTHNFDVRLWQHISMWATARSAKLDRVMTLKKQVWDLMELWMALSFLSIELELKILHTFLQLLFIFYDEVLRLESEISRHPCESILIQ